MPENNQDVRSKVLDIYTKYHASVKNFGSYIENSSYLIDTSNSQDFTNITNFLCTAFFKDSTAIEQYETDISNTFGNILINYCEKGLTHSEILSLLEHVNKYTVEINNIFKENALETINNLKFPSKWKYAYGLTTDSTGTLSTLDSNKYIQRLIENTKIVYTARSLINSEYLSYIESNPIADLNQRNAKYIEIANSDKYKFDIISPESKKITDLENNFILNYLVSLIERNDVNLVLKDLSKTEIHRASYLHNVGIAGTELENVDTTSDEFAEYIVGFLKALDNATTNMVKENAKYPIPKFDGINLNEHNIIIETESGKSVAQSVTVSDKLGNGSDIVLNSFIICDYYQNPLIDENENKSYIKIFKKKLSFKLFTATELNQYRFNYEQTKPGEKFETNQIVFGMTINNGSYAITDNFKFIDRNTEEPIDNTNGIYALGLSIVDEGEEKVDYYRTTSGDKLISATIESEFNNADKAENLKELCDRFSAIVSGQNVASNQTFELDTIDAESILTASYSNPNFTLNYLISNLNSLYTFSNYETIRATTLNIIYDFAEPSNNINSTEETIINNADLNNIYNQDYLTVIKLINLDLDLTDETDIKIKGLLDSLLGYKVDATNINFKSDYGTDIDEAKNTYFKTVEALLRAQKQITRASIYILYKELNNNLRSIESSLLNEELFAAFYVTKDHTLPYTYLNSEYDIYSDERVIDSDELNVLKSTYSNPYISRIAKKYDIISYKYGDLIGYGTNSTEINEINSFITLYKETRDYFFKVQYNKSFALDELYNIYCLMYCITFTINRWFTSKIALNKDVNYYTLNDCRNFFESYGMEDIANIIMLNDQGNAISSFYNQLDYCKRIISNYSELAKYKGSKYIIDLLSEVFTDDINFITVNKYLIFEDLRDNTIKFLSVPYDSNNSINTINNNISNAENYYDVTGSDIYWNGGSVNGQYNLPENIIVDYKISPQSTKYLGLSVSTNISDIYYRTRYSFAMLEYLVDCFYESAKGGESNDATPYAIISKIYFNVNIGGDSVVNIATLMQMIFTLFKEYEMCNIFMNQVNNENAKSESLSAKTTAKKAKAPREETTPTDYKPTYYNINRNATFDLFVKNLVKNKVFQATHDFAYKTDDSDEEAAIREFLSDFYVHYLFQNVGNNEIATYKGGKEDKEKFFYFNLYEYKFNPKTDIDTDGYIKDNIAETILNQTNKNNISYPIIPIYTATAQNSFVYLPDNNKFFNYFKERMSNAEITQENNNELNFVEQMQSILNNISIIMLMNNKNETLAANANGNVFTANSDGDVAKIKEAAEMFNAAYEYNKQILLSSNEPTYSSSDILNSGSTALSFSSMYENAISNIIDFPLRYLEGKYQVSQNTINNYMLYNFDVRTFLDTIFETFYISEEEPGIKLYTMVDGTVTRENVLDIDTTSELFNKKFNFRRKLTNSESPGSDEITVERVIKYVFEDLYNTEDYNVENGVTKLQLFPDIETTVEQLQNASAQILLKINSLVEALNSILVGIDDISVYFNIGENKNEIVDFIVELVRLFISYTTYLYNISANNIYDNEYESIPFTDDFSETITTNYSDENYYDENFKIVVETN